MSIVELIPVHGRWQTGVGTVMMNTIVKLVVFILHLVFVHFIHLVLWRRMTTLCGRLGWESSRIGLHSVSCRPSRPRAGSEGWMVGWMMHNRRCWSTARHGQHDGHISLLLFFPFCAGSRLQVGGQLSLSRAACAPKALLSLGSLVVLGHAMALNPSSKIVEGSCQRSCKSLRSVL